MGHTVFQDSVQGALVEARSRGARKLGHSFSYGRECENGDGAPKSFTDYRTLRI